MFQKFTMRKLIDPFTINLPHLDLHGETSDTIFYLIYSFIKDNYLLGNNKIIIIHGRSGGVLKKETQVILKNNKLVKNHYIDALNDGQTIVEIDIKK